MTLKLKNKTWVYCRTKFVSREYLIKANINIIHGTLNSKKNWIRIFEMKKRDVKLGNSQIWDKQLFI